MSYASGAPGSFYGSPANPCAEVEALRLEVARLRAENGRLSEAGREWRLSDLRLKALLESEGIGVLIGDLSGTILQVNGSLARMAGYGRDELVSVPQLWRRCVPPEEWERHCERAERLRNGGVCAPWETALLRPDGSRLPILTGAAIIEEAVPETLEKPGWGGGEIKRQTMLMWALDISERRAAEDELRVSEAQMRAIVENLHDGLLITDLDDTITYANWRISELCGFSRAELVGQKAYRVLVEEGRWALCQKRNRERALGASGTYELPLRHKDGSVWWALINGSPLRNASGAIVGTIGAHFDITQRKASEAELNRFARQLELSNRDLEAFAYAVSHDLKEPLRKIEVFGSRLDSLEGGQLTFEGRETLGRMRGAARRMHGLIDGLLLYSRVATRSDGWNWIELDDVAREVLLDLELAVERAGARVEIGPLPRLYADAIQMRQLLQNLIGNALKFGRAGVPVEVRVSGRDEQGVCSLTVADNGRGFAAREAETIFEIFRRLPETNPNPNPISDTAAAGTGVGLTICRKIVERHGGRIWARSQPDGGATFQLEMPTGERKGGADGVAI